MKGHRCAEGPERQRKRRASEQDIILNQQANAARVCFSRMSNQSFPVQADKVSTQAQALPAESAKTPPGLSDPERWVELYGDYLFKYALLRLRDPAKAEDAVQETFLAALKGGKTFQGRSAEKSWLVGILKNKVCHHYRKASPRSRRWADPSDPTGAENVVDVA